MKNLKLFSSLTILNLIVVVSTAQQVTDTSFDYTITHPMYAAGKGPVIILDEAHYNFHTLEDRYRPFAHLLQKDGYVVQPNKEKFTPSFLPTIKILVIANALPDDTSEWKLPAKSAFTKEEINAVNAWVNNGGSLFLIADHMPFAGAAADLALSFGFNFMNGYAVRTDDDPETFSKREHTLTVNKLTQGRNKSEAIDSIAIFTGQGFIGAKNAVPVTLLDKHYKIYLPSDAADINKTTPVINGCGLVNGAYMQYGKGRIVVFGEAAMFSAQLAGSEQEKVGMNNLLANQNPQFLLNIIHWIDKKI
jgi:hypothetical protein